ncbi:MAG: ABC transporter permease [Treponema sp.]|jgi:ABC-type transport system involved in multi-copper enzyme maturation permease subunit|nr:ABC transporter permease [Treponema sp.]
MNIVKSELYKLAIFKPFYICLSICVALVALFGLSIQGVDVEYAEASAGGIGAVALIEQTLDLPFLPFLFAVFVSLFVCGEFHNGTVKNYVSKGCNRVGIYVSKLAVCGIAVLTMYTAYVALLGIMGTVLLGFDPQGVAAFSNITAMLLGEGLLMFAYTSVFVLVSMGLRGVGASIAVNICIVSFLPIILRASSFILGGDIMLEDYWISTHITALASLTPESGTVPRGILVGLCYVAGGTLVGSVLFKNVDIK